jgi:flagellar basal-body rod protein FlgB
MSDSFSNINFDPVINNLEKGLDGASKRQRIISNNIANVDTPNFKRSDIGFEQELKRAIAEGKDALRLTVTQSDHMLNTASGASAFPVTQDNSATFRNDGNNVDIEKEIVEQTKNNVLYNSFIQILESKFGLLRYSIQEGK